MIPRQWVFYLESVPFTPDAILGKTSLGGSESAAIGMMRALAARGHDVQCFATRLERPGEYGGVTWHQAETDLGPALQFLTPDVFVALRLPTPFVRFAVPAAWNVLWCEDLLTDSSVTATLSQVDELWFVSDYHRAQWVNKEPMIGPLAWVTKNGVDLSLFPVQVWPGGASWRDGVTVTRDPHRYIYASRPERALKPLLELWPEIRKADPKATLGICRYRSMYDGEGSQVQQMVASFDRLTEAVIAQVGGIEWLGELGKRPLYEAMAGCRAMLYPGVAGFAETGGIVASEAQMCGTPFIGSWRGSLPETLHPDAGILLDGDAETAEYQRAYVTAVQTLPGLDDPCYARMQDAGRRHAKGYSFDTLAAEWEAHVEARFAARYAAQKPAILRTLLHWDRHVMARDVADQLLTAHGWGSGDEAAKWQAELGAADGHKWPVYNAAFAVRQLCDTVIAGQHQVEADYADGAVQDAVHESEVSIRFREVIAVVKEQGRTPARCLDVACGNGGFALALAKAFPEAHVTGVDYSPGVLELAQKGVTALGLADRVEFIVHDWRPLPAGPYDLVTCGEFIEHVEHPHELINALEAACAPDGLCALTCPCGPFSELLPHPETRKRGHLHAYSHQQLARLFAGRQWSLRHLMMGYSPRGMPIGHWIVTWTPDPAHPVQPLDCHDDLVTTRPYQQLTVIMIVKDGEDWLRKCLKSLLCVDEVLIHDTGSSDGSVALARELGAIVVQTDWPESFAVARNRVVADAEARGADWILWIDCDEVLEGFERVRRYLSGAGPFLGYVIRQQHLMMDAPQFHDKPVRLFRAKRGIRFFGAVHEQPETAPDAGIWPSLELPDVDLIHLGYHRDTERRRKLLTRNLPLLKKQLEAPEGERRRLDLVLFVRDCMNITMFERETNRGQLTQKAWTHAQAGIKAYQRHFADPGDKYHDIGRPFYESCLAMTGQGLEIGWALGAGVPQLLGKLQPEKFRVADLTEARVELAARINSILAPLEPPKVDTRPVTERTGHRG